MQMDKTPRILLKIKNKCMRKLSLILILTYCSANIFAQAPDIEWQNTIGGTSADLCYNALATSDGGFLLIGNSNSFISGDKTENNLGIAASYDYWVVKIDASGNVVWDNTIGGYKSEDLRSLIETSDGGYLLGGWSDSDISVDKSENRIGGAGYGDYWVVKLDLDGNILWENTIGGTKSDELYDIEETASGTYILGGTSYSPADFDKTIPSTNHDIWLVEIDNLGNVIWQKVIGGSSTDRFVEMEITSDGGLLIGASSLSGISGDKTEINHGGNDLWVIKLDAARNIQWENSFGGTISDYMRDVIELPEGGYMILGASQSNMSADKSDNAFGVMNYNDFWLIKLDEDGNALWDTIYGGDGEDYPASVMLSTDGNILLLGNSNSQISGNKTTNTYASTYDIWVIKITTNGVKLWEKCMGGDSYDFPAEMVLANDGGVVIASQSYSTVSGDKTEANVGGASSDFWVIKLVSEVCPAPVGLYADNITPNKATIHWDNITAAESYQIWYRPIGGGAWLKKSAPTNVKTIKSLLPASTYEYKIRTSCNPGEYSEFSAVNNFTTLPFRTAVDLLETDYQVYPNPAINELVITGNFSGQTQLQIVDVTGKLVQQIICISNSNEQLLDVSSLPSGMYYITIKNSNTIQTIQFIHQ